MCYTTKTVIKCASSISPITLGSLYDVVHTPALLITSPPGSPQANFPHIENQDLRACSCQTLIIYYSMFTLWLVQVISELKLEAPRSSEVMCSEYTRFINVVLVFYTGAIKKVPIGKFLDLDIYIFIRPVTSLKHRMLKVSRSPLIGHGF